VTVNDQTHQAEQFEQHRARLEAVAYRMLGSLSEAQDAVQETWLRLSGSRIEAIDNLGGWLTTVIGRVCIDMLRARRARREDYVGTWLPEAIVSRDEEADPEAETMLADTVAVALLVVLETLTPAERLAFVLHDMFGVSFEEIAPIVDRSTDAARQLASRARRRVRGGAPGADADPERQRQVVSAFLAASRAGDFDALLALLDPDVVFRSDSGAAIELAPAQVAGASEVARFSTTRGTLFAQLCHPALVNGTPGLVVLGRSAGPPIGAVAFTLSERRGLIATIDLILDQAKLHPAQAGN
jgi:RNA polymerase sigma-70 factor (ECF subfamily)